MEKTPVNKIAYIIKKIFINTCIIFTVTMLFIASMGYAISQTDAAFPLPVLISLLFSLTVAVSAIVFEIKILPVISRHILFFALLYVILMFLYIPAVLVSITSRATFYFSVIYILIYIICIVIYFMIKRLSRRMREKRQNYENMFDKANENNK